MTILFIRNTVRHHCEVIESVIVKYKNIIKNKVDEIYLGLIPNLLWNSQFKDYIKNKYPNVKLSVPKNYDYFIEVTTKKNKIITESKNYFYIIHELRPNIDTFSNVFGLSPLFRNYIYADLLPLNENIKMNKDYPIYLIQGNKDPKRRNFLLLDKILENIYDFKFKIRWAGSGELDKKYDLFKKKGLLEETRGNFLDYHQNFLDGYCIIPLTLKKTQPQYYSSKLTSTINYAKGYNLKCLIDKDLQDIYKLSNVEIFNDENDIVDRFRKTLEDFYKN